MLGVEPVRTIYDRFQKSFGFGIRGMRKFPEVIPTVVFTVVWVAGAFAYMAYALIKKPDVVINKCDCAPWEKVKPTEPRKLYIVNPCIYRVNPQLEELRQFIGTYRPCGPCRPPTGCIEP